jgi:glycosyltransferase involved in cell wall biosynthesis
MSTKCEVSVVMSVYNGALNLTPSMNGILSQEGVSLEFIVVNDGSTDNTGEILDDYARRDPRVRIIYQENSGLTRALINGCGVAAGEFIARQDADDLSLPGRLARQLEVLRKNPNVVMTSCGTRFIGPDNEILYEVRQNGEELQRGLQHVDLGRVRGPSSHTSVMFRRQAFEKVGGYRAQFDVAQDLDLWMRLSEVGLCWAIAEVDCEFRLSKHSISVVRKAEQLRAAKLILKCAAARRSGRDDSQLIASGRQHVWRYFYWTPKRLQEARFYYFVGSVLRHNDPKKARLYFWSAIRSWFAHLGAWRRILAISRVE